MKNEGMNRKMQAAERNRVRGDITDAPILGMRENALHTAWFRGLRVNLRKMPITQGHILR